MHISTYFFAERVISHFQCVKILFNSFVFFDFLVKLVLQLLKLLNNETTYVGHDYMPAYYLNQNYVKLLVYPKYGVQFCNLHVFTKYFIQFNCYMQHVSYLNAIIMNHHFRWQANFAPKHKIREKYCWNQQQHGTKILSLTYKVLTTTQPAYQYSLVSVQPHHSTRSSMS